VYVGIDVFGRGCPGGGGLNSCEVSQSEIGGGVVCVGEGVVCVVGGVACVWLEEWRVCSWRCVWLQLHL